MLSKPRIHFGDYDYTGGVGWMHKQQALIKELCIQTGRRKQAMVGNKMKHIVETDD